MRSAAIEKAVPIKMGIGSGPDGNTVPTVDLEPLLREAIEDVHAKHHWVAACMGISKSHLSEMLAGKRALTLDRIERAPVDVQQAFARRYAEAMAWTVSAVDPVAAAALDLQIATARMQAALTARGLPERTIAQARMELPR